MMMRCLDDFGLFCQNKPKNGDLVTTVTKKGDDTHIDAQIAARLANEPQILVNGRFYPRILWVDIFMTWRGRRTQIFHTIDVLERQFVASHTHHIPYPQFAKKQTAMKFLRLQILTIYRDIIPILRITIITQKPRTG